MLNFTVGPVQPFRCVKEKGEEVVPYFRTEEFSAVVRKCEEYMGKFLNASQNSRTVFLTGSGTAAMEAAIINTLSLADRVLIINGGDFGQRFCEICKLYKIRYDQVKLEYGKDITEKDLNLYNKVGYTAFLINIHETSTGTLYDANVVRDFCKENNCFLIVDAISSFLADEFSMYKLGADVVITSSQKALACPPGISMITLSERAIKRIFLKSTSSYYLDLKKALLDGERGQTPYTPAVGIILQIYERLKEIENKGGVAIELKRIEDITEDFRKGIKGLPLNCLSKKMSNAVTALVTNETKAYDVFLKLKNDYGIWVCPNGGELKDKVFRVGHLGNLSKTDNEILINALKELAEKEFLK